MLALVENSVTEELLCTQMAHLTHRSTFDELRRMHHGGGHLFGQSPTGHGGQPLGLEDDCGDVWSIRLTSSLWNDHIYLFCVGGPGVSGSVVMGSSSDRSDGVWICLTDHRRRAQLEKVGLFYRALYMAWLNLLELCKNTAPPPSNQPKWQKRTCVSTLHFLLKASD